ncbi:MAG: hypothetical protein PHQ22_08485 [Sulfuricurvum sp.]|nr:hypothetical protein [Sulfuricurvum sp.]MDD5387214.1 hypothetical protein [Sulfuricurvum sp.]
MKELSVIDLKLALEHDIKMALYTYERYNIDANLALVACNDYNVDKAHLMDSVRHSDVAKKINDHYIAVLFTFVDHIGARTALEKLVNLYPDYHLRGSLIVLKKEDTIESVCERLLEANYFIHQDPHNKIFHEFDHTLT